MQQEKSHWRKYLSLSNIISALLLVLIIGMIVNPEWKAGFIKGLMKVGLYQPDIPEEVRQEDLSRHLQVSFKDYRGMSLSLEELKGRVVFLNFWATWCPPCIAEMESIDQLYRQYKNDPSVIFLMVDVDGDMARSQEFMNKRGYELKAWAPAGAIPEELFGGSLPTTIILDRTGAKVMEHIGPADYASSKMQDFIKKLVAMP